MSAQSCTTCGKSGHNARFHAADRRTVQRIPGFLPEISPTDPVVLALAAHGWTCPECRNALERNMGRPGEIRVFLDLCADARLILRDTPFWWESTTPGPGRDS